MKEVVGVCGGSETFLELGRGETFFKILKY